MKCIKYLVFLCLLLTTLSKAQVAVYGKVEHIVPDGVDTQGNITLTVSGSTAPYTYTWNPGAINTKDISNITAGQYTVNVKSASSQTLNCYYNMGYKALWTNLNNAVSRNDSIISNAPNTNVYGTAVSKNTLLAGTDGWFEIVMNNVTTTNRFFIGLVDQVSPYTRYDEINYGLYYTTAKQLYCFERSVGTFSLNLTPKVGDVVRVERVGNTINYKINNTTVRTVTVSGISSKNYKLKVALQAVTQLANVGCSFANLSNNSFPGYISVIPTIKHSSDLGASDGSIKVVPKVPFTNTYTWSPGTSTAQTTSSLSAGTSTLTIADSLLNSSTLNFNVGYKVLWTNTDRCFSRNDSLVSTSTTASVYGTAISKNTLPANTDGWMEYVINEFGTNNQYIGFTQSASPIQYTGADLDYVMLYTGSSKTLSYYETGTTNIINYNANVGDVIRIERIDSTIIYRINGIAFRSTTVPGLKQRPLKIKAQLAGPNRIVNVGCSFYNKSNAIWNDYVQVYPLIKHNSDIGTSDGSIKLTPKIPFTNTYSWTPGGATTASVSSLAPGNYSVTVKDSLQNQSPYTYNVGYKVRWTNMDRCTFRNDSLFSTTNNANIIATATSKNTLEAYTDGWFEYVFDASAANNSYIGFLDSVMQYPYSYGDLDYGVLCNGTSLSYYENGGGSTAVMTTHLRVGDIIRVQRVGDVISYKVNGYNYRSITVTGISQKVWKIKSNLVSLGRFVNVGCSFIKLDNVDFANYVQISAKVTHNTALGNNDGIVKVTPRIPFSNTYSWLPGGATTGTITNVPVGTSTLTIADSLNNKSRFRINMGYKPNWTGLSNALISGDTLKGNVTTNASAYTKDTLLPYTNGWVEYVYSEPTAKSFYFGFLDAVGSPTVATDIDYGFYFNGSTLISTFSGTATAAWTYNFKIGDVVKIERYGDTIRYSLNGRLARVVVAAGISSKAYRVKALLVNKAKLIDLGLSFTLCRATVSAGSTQTITCTSPTVTLTSSTSYTSGMTYSWTPGGSSSTSYSTQTSTAGTYTLKMTYTNGCIYTPTVSVVQNTIAPGVTIESSSPTPTLGLNAYWPFTGNADDKSGNGNNGTVTSAGLTADRFGNPNRAYEFDGTTSRIDVPNSATVDMPNGQDYSISFWMKSKSGNVDAIPISKNEYGAWSGYMFFANSTNGGYCNTPGHGSFYLAAGGGGDACSDIPFCNDTTSWYFITGQYNATTNQVFMYVNGVLQADVGTASGPTSNTKPLSFGSYNDGAGIGYYKGALDDIRMYNRMLSQDEIDALYHESNPLANVMTCAAPSLNLIAISPTPGLSYSWTPGGSSPTSSITTITNGGTYSLSVTNTVTGCASSSSVSVVFNLCTSVDIENYVNDTTKGQVNFTIGGGSPPYEVVWNGAKIPSNSSVLALMALYTGTATTIDSVKIRDGLDSLRTLSNYTNLQPGVYPFDIYDQVNDSINAMAVVGTKITWATSKNVSMQDQSVKPRYHNEKMYVYGNAVKVTQSGTFYPDSSFAVAANHIADDYSNYVEFVYPDSTYICKVGFQKDTAAIESLSDKCYFEFNGMDSVKIHFLDSVIYNGPTNTGDLYAMANDTSTGNITFYRNGTLLVSREYSRLNPSAGLLFKVAMGSAASKINSIIMITSSVYTSDYVMGTVKDVSCGSNCSGSIDAKGVIANGAFAVKPVKYELEDLSNPGVIVSTIHYPGGINHALFQNLCPGNYRVTYHAIAVYNLLGVIISLPVTATGDFEIAYMPDWGNAANVSIDPNDRSLTKNAGVSTVFTWDAGASSLNKLSHLKNGWIEWTGYASNIFSPNYGVIGIGFTSSLQNPASADIATINYGVGVLGVLSSWVKVNNQLIISALMTPPVTQGSFMTNDVFRLEKNGTTVTLKINGNLTPYSVTIPSGTDLVADASIQFLNNQIKHPRVSFGCPYVEEYTLLKKKLDGGYYTTHDQKLLFKYDEEYADVDGKLTFNIYDKYNKVVMNNTSMPSGSQPASVYGDNRYSIDIGNASHYVTGQTMPNNNFYILEVINEKNEKWYLRFKK